jgi:hypothetical protein
MFEIRNCNVQAVWLFVAMRIIDYYYYYYYYSSLLCPVEFFCASVHVICHLVYVNKHVLADVVIFRYKSVLALEMKYRTVYS